MYCKNCGSEIQENQKFCKKCGTPVAESAEQNAISDKQPTHPITPTVNETESKQQKPKMSKGKKAKIICISVFAAIAVIFASLVAVYFTSPAYSVYKNLKDVDCSAAVREYNSSVENNFIQEIFIKIVLNGYGDKILNEFRDGEINFEDALSILEAMKEMGIKDIDKSLDEINGLTKLTTLLKMIQNLKRMETFSSLKRLRIIPLSQQKKWISILKLDLFTCMTAIQLMI